MTMVSAFQAGQNISNRKRQIENQLAQMVLRQQNQEMMYGLREAEFNRKLDQGNQRLALAEAGLGLRATMDEFRMQKDRETMDAVSGAAQELGAIDLPPGDPRRPAAIWKVIHNNARAAKAMPQLFKDAFGNYNSAAKTATSSWEHDYNDFLKDVKNTIGRGQITDLNLLYNQDQWKPKWVDKAGKDLPQQPGTPGYTVPEGAKKTESLWTELPSTQPGQHTYVTLPASKITQLRNDMVALEKRRQNLPSQVSNEYAIPDTSTAASDKRTQAEAYLKSNNLKASPENIQYYMDHAP